MENGDQDQRRMTRGAYASHVKGPKLCAACADAAAATEGTQSVRPLRGRTPKNYLTEPAALRRAGLASNIIRFIRSLCARLRSLRGLCCAPLAGPINRIM